MDDYYFHVKNLDYHSNHLFCVTTDSCLQAKSHYSSQTFYSTVQACVPFVIHSAIKLMLDIVFLLLK